MKELSKRRERKIYVEFDKKRIYTIFKEYFDIQNSYRNLVPIEPYKRGYDRWFGLRDDVKKRDDANRIAECLVFVQNKDWSKNKDFVKKDYKTKKMVKVELGIKDVDKKIFEDETKVPLYLHKYFELTFYPPYHIKIGKSLHITPGRWVYRFKDKHMFKYVVKPHWVTHAYVVDPDLQSREQELKNIIDNSNLWIKYYKYMSKSNGYDYDDNYTFNKLEKKEALKEIKTLNY